MWPKINWISLPEFHRFSLERQTWDQLLLQYQNEVPPEETPRWDPRTGKEQLAVFLLGGIWFEFISNPFVQTEWWICSHISVNFKVSICFPWWKGGQKWKPKCHCFQTQNRTASRLCFGYHSQSTGRWAHGHPCTCSPGTEPTSLLKRL